MQVYKLNNGIRVASEKLPYLKSISVGIWVGAGCFAEDEKNNGISHFIEHMLFKGTKKRSAAEIAGCIDALGGVLNAFTAKECTCFYVNILSEHYGVAIDLLCDMLINSRFDKDDIAREAGVVCEEIAMVEDTPDDLANENLARAYYGTHPLGQTILGSAENVRSFSADMIKEYMSSHTKKDFAIITNSNDQLKKELQEKLGYQKDNRIKFVGTVYDQELLKKIREEAYGYFHGHEVGGTNPSLLEALGSTKLNLLLDVGFNREVAEDAAF